MMPLRPRMKPRSYRRWKRQLAQVERLRGLATDTVFLDALHGAMRASRKAHPEATSMPLGEVLAFADPSVVAGRGFYRKVPAAEGAARNRQLRRRR